jgi:hypothetical protein
MNNKYIYYGGILVLSLLLFFFLKRHVNSLNQAIEEENLIIQADNLSADPFPNEENTSTTIGDKKEVEAGEYKGTYWNHPYIRTGDVEDGDKSISIYIDKENKNASRIEFEDYMPRVDADGEVEIVARFECSRTFTQLSETTLLMDKTEDYCLEGQDKLHFISVDDQQGISFDGRTISYYKEQNIMPDFEPQALLKRFYSGFEFNGKKLEGTNPNARGNTVVFGNVRYYEDSSSTYALVFFKEYFKGVIGAADGPNSNLLNIAKFKKTALGMRFIEFVHDCPCGSVDGKITYPSIQKIGNKHFLLKTTPIEAGRRTLYFYDAESFEEVLVLNVDSHESISFTKEEDNDCAIILESDSSAINSDLDIYLFDEYRNAFVQEENK